MTCVMKLTGVVSRNEMSGEVLPRVTEAASRYVSRRGTCKL